MPAKWSKWHRDQGDRSKRLCIDDDGSTYTQFDNEHSAILDEGGNPITRDAARALLFSIQETPRSAFNNLSSFPTQTDRSQAGTSTVGSEPSYVHASNSDQPSRGLNLSVPNDDDGYEEDDEVPNLPINQMILFYGTMAGQPLTGQARADLQSVRTGRSLPPDYVERHSSFFLLGTVFRVLWVEAKGTTAGNHQADDEVYKTLRPMIVVSKRKAHCICAPIFSYGNQGCGKDGLVENEVQHHAVVQMNGKPAKLMTAEKKWDNIIKMKDAFTIEPISKTTSLKASSRVRFDTTYPVRYNLKVLILGRVIKDHRARLQDRWRKANNS